MTWREAVLIWISILCASTKAGACRAFLLFAIGLSSKEYCGDYFRLSTYGQLGKGCAWLVRWNWR